MSSHVPGTTLEVVPPHYILSSDAAPDILVSQSGVAVYPVENYVKMSGDSWVNTLKCTGEIRTQQINH